MQTADVFQRQAEEVRAIFGDLEIVEARTDFLLYVEATEKVDGVKGDPNRCMFSQACKRALGSKGVLFYPTVAYVDVVDPKDHTRRVVMRFMLPARTRQALEDFDQSRGAPWAASFVLKAVPKGSTLKARAAKQRARNRRLEPAERSERKSAAARKAHETRRTKALMGVRSGAGQVHTRPVNQ